MNPKQSQWNVTQLSEYRTKKSMSDDLVARVTMANNKESDDFRKHADEAIALGNSHIKHEA